MTTQAMPLFRCSVWGCLNYERKEKNFFVKWFWDVGRSRCSVCDNACDARFDEITFTGGSRVKGLILDENITVCDISSGNDFVIPVRGIGTMRRSVSKSGTLEIRYRMGNSGEQKVGGSLKEPLRLYVPETGQVMKLEQSSLEHVSVIPTISGSLGQLVDILGEGVEQIPTMSPSELSGGLREIGKHITDIRDTFESVEQPSVERRKLESERMQAELDTAQAETGIEEQRLQKSRLQEERRGIGEQRTEQQRTSRVSPSEKYRAETQEMREEMNLKVERVQVIKEDKMRTLAGIDRAEDPELYRQTENYFDNKIREAMEE